MYLTERNVDNPRCGYSKIYAYFYIIIVVISIIIKYFGTIVSVGLVGQCANEFLMVEAWDGRINTNYKSFMARTNPINDGAYFPSSL